MFKLKGKTRPEFFAMLFLVMITLAAYWKLPRHNFLTFDDNGYITENTHVHQGITLKNIVWSFSSTDYGYWHPLTWMSHMLAFQLFGLKPGMHHLINLILHISSALLLFYVLNRMTGAFWQSLFVAAAFAIHPLNVESVAWASERKNVLSTFFWMLTMLTYIRYAEHPGLKRYLLMLCVFALGLMSKPMLVTLPFVLLLLDYWPLGRFNLSSQSYFNHQEAHKPKRAVSPRSIVFTLVLEKVALLMLSIICIYYSTLSFQRFKNVVSTTLVPMKLRISNALISYVSYIKKMVWPHDLAVYYPYPDTVPLWQVVGAGLVLLSISFFVFRKLRSKPYFAVGWLWYMGTLFPAIGLVQAGLWPATADRFVYVPLIGLFICISWGLYDFFGQWRYKKVVFMAVGGIIFSVLTVTTGLQAGYWQNDVSLFTHNVRVTPNNSVAYTELGNALERQNNLDKAILNYSEALRINPKNAQAHNNLGYALTRRKNYKAAIDHYREALRLRPTYAEAHNNLGTALLYQGKEKEAIHHFYEALKINPNYAGPYFNLGKVFANKLNIDKAILLYKKALELDPEMVQALYNLTWILATSEDKNYRNGEEAVKLAERLCKVTQYRQPPLLDALAAAYAEAKKFDMAILIAQKGIELAEKQGAEKLASGLIKRLKEYKTGKPYRQNLNNKNES